SIFGVRRRPVFGGVILNELICGELDGLSSLLAGLFFDDLAVALLQPLALVALLLDRLRIVGSTSGAAVPPAVQFELVMVELAVFENAHAANFASTPWGSSVAEQSSRRFARSARPNPRLFTWLCGTTAARLRFKKSRDVAHLVSDHRAVDAAEGAANIQSPFALQHFYGTAADRGVDVLIDPCPWNRRHLGQIYHTGNAAHIAITARRSDRATTPHA